MKKDEHILNGNKGRIFVRIFKGEMKVKKIWGLVICFLMMINITVFALSEPAVSFTMDGTTKKGDKIILYVQVKDVDRLYAASVDYIYDPEEIKVTYIGGADLIADNQEILELGGETDKDGNRARYQMTFTGKVDGLKGSGNLVKIEAEILKDCVIELKPENMKVKLVNVDSSYNISNMDFKYESFTTEVSGEKPLDSNNNSNTNKPDQGTNNSKPIANEGTSKDEAENKGNTDNGSSEGKNQEGNNGGTDVNNDEIEVESNATEVNEEKNNDGEEFNDKNKDDAETNAYTKNEGNEPNKNGTSYIYVLALIFILGLSVSGYLFIKNRNEKCK